MPFIDVLVAQPAGSLPASTAEIARVLTDLTTELLAKKRELTAVMVREMASADWFVGGRSLDELASASHRVTVHVTAGTNTDAEKAAWIAAVAAAMKRLTGPSRPESYVVVAEVAAQAWGWDGLTQAARRTSTA